MTAFDPNHAVLDQGLQLLKSLPRDLFDTDDASSGQSLGPHFRHCIEFYRAFLNGLETARIDYDARPRKRGLESDPLEAARAIETILREFEALGDQPTERPLSVRCDAETDGTEAWHPSSVGRELTFLLSHTVHHYALIAQILRSHGVEPEPDFGLAPSTRRFRERTSVPCAR